MSKPTPANAVEHLDLIWNDPEEVRHRALALTIMKEEEAKRKGK